MRHLSNNFDPSFISIVPIRADALLLRLLWGLAFSSLLHAHVLTALHGLCQASMDEAGLSIRSV